jgi:hypothetical protein
MSIRQATIEMTGNQILGRCGASGQYMMAGIQTDMMISGNGLVKPTKFTHTHAYIL